MKIHGKKIEGANEVTIIIPRSSGADIILKARAVLDMESFETMCPPPEPPRKMYAGGQEVPNLKDPGYLAQVDKYSTLRLNWLILSSLAATPGLEWDTVNLSDSTTWDNYQSELKEAGFSSIEVNRIIAECINVNALNEDKIEEARERFLQEAQDQVEK